MPSARTGPKGALSNAGFLLPITPVKTLRVLLLLLGIWVIIEAVFGMLSYLVPWAKGVTETTFMDGMSLLTWTFALVCGFGVLRLKNWARRGLIGLVTLKFLLSVYAFFSVRNIGMDTFGLFIAATMCLAFGATLIGLFRAAEITRAARKPNLMWWTVAGIVIAGTMALIYKDNHSYIYPLKLEDLGLKSAGELNFLKKANGWKLTRLEMTGSSGGNATIRETATESRMTFLRDDDRMIMILRGVPQLKGCDLEIDLERNVLKLNDSVFIGKPFKTERLIWGDVPAEGVEFNNDVMARFSGRIIIARALEKDEVFLFLTLDVYGKTVEAYYVARPRPPA